MTSTNHRAPAPRFNCIPNWQWPGCIDRSASVVLSPGKPRVSFGTSPQKWSLSIVYHERHEPLTMFQVVSFHSTTIDGKFGVAKDNACWKDMDLDNVIRSLTHNPWDEQQKRPAAYFRKSKPEFCPGGSECHDAIYCHSAECHPQCLRGRKPLHGEWDIARLNMDPKCRPGRRINQFLRWHFFSPNLEINYHAVAQKCVRGPKWCRLNVMGGNI